MSDDKPTTVRFAPESLMDYHDVGEGLRLCEHIRLPNCYKDNSNSEYASGVKVHCEVCDETFRVTELIN